MKVSLNWLKDFVEFHKKVTPEEISWRITEATAEIEGVQHIGAGLEDVVVGELVETKKHPEADKLFVGKVKISPKKTIQVIYGDKAEVAIGDKVPTAIAPQQLPGGKIERGKIRGQLSEGMLCLDSELVEGYQSSLTKFPKKTKVGDSITKHMPIQDVVFEIDNHSITHRADLFSQYGFAREMVALGLAKWKKSYPAWNLKKMVGKKAMPFKVSFKQQHIQKSYHSTVVEGVDGRPAPDWMRFRLQACGIRAINALVDITNYVMLEAGAPMHAFDRETITGKHFEFRLSKKGEKMVTLDGSTQELFKDVMVVENDGRIIDLVGIMGGENTEIRNETTSVYYHQGVYDPVLIRKAMIGLGHRTDAGTIYEKGIDPQVSETGMARTLELTKEIFPDAVFDHEMFMVKPETTKKQKIILPKEKMTKCMGIEIPDKDAERILKDLGFTVKMTTKEIQATAPSWRAENVQIPEDLIEEIARVYGYSNVEAKAPEVALMTPVKNHKRHVKRTVQKFLTGLGFQEEVNFSFISAEMLQNMQIDIDHSLIEIANPVSEDFRYMRPSHLPSMLNNLSRKQVHDNRSWRTFETGAIFSRVENDVREDRALTLLLAEPKEGHVFANALSMLQKLSQELSIDLQTKSGEHHAAYPGRCLEVHSGELMLGYFYELHPMLKEQGKLKGTIIAIEIDLELLYAAKQQEMKYNPINRNPSALLDINVVVDHNTMVKEIDQLIRSVDSEYVADVQLVDIYEGSNLGEGKKSFTFALTYQHPERTLEEQEIQSILDKLIKTLEKSGGIVRR